VVVEHPDGLVDPARVRELDAPVGQRRHGQREPVHEIAGQLDACHRGPLRQPERGPDLRGTEPVDLVLVDGRVTVGRLDARGPRPGALLRDELAVGALPTLPQLGDGGQAKRLRPGRHRRGGGHQVHEAPVGQDSGIGDGEIRHHLAHDPLLEHGSDATRAPGHNSRTGWHRRSGLRCAAAGPRTACSAPPSCASTPRPSAGWSSAGPPGSPACPP
jgi:hypothetical protein